MFRLEGSNDVIYLPNPLFDDGFDRSDTVQVKRTESGATHTMIQTKKRVYTYQFKISSPKKNDFIDWLKNHGHELIYLISDKRTIKGYINQTMTLRSIGRSYGSTDIRESWDLTLVFYENS